MILLQGKALCKTYRIRSRAPVHALQNVSCEVPENSWITVTGPSGSGKSTLVALLAALERPTSGQVLIQGRDISLASDVEQSLYRRQRVGIVFQEYQLLEHLTGWENVAMPLMVTSMGRRQRKKRAMALLERLNLADRADHLPRQLSGGERQRLALARALVHDPEILFADEPTSNIDLAAARQVVDLFVELKKQGHTLVIISHDPELAQQGDQVLRLDRGRLVE